MNFFKLYHPVYNSDHHDSRVNPVEPQDEFAVPCIICSACGDGPCIGYWQRYFTLPEGFNDPRFLQRGPLIDVELYPLIDELKVLLKLPPDYPIAPGCQLGIPAYSVNSTTADVVFWLGPCLMAPRVVDALLAGAVTGIDPVKAKITWRKRSKDKHLPPPEWYSPNVTGRASYANITLGPILCARCQHRVNTSPDELLIDESHWDGSDIFSPHSHPAHVIVTERVKDLFEEHQFTNCRFMPIGSVKRDAN